MSKHGGIKTILNEFGIRSRIEVSHARGFFKGALQEKEGRLEETEIERLLAIYQKLVTMDVRTLGNISRSTMVGLGHALLLSLKKEGLKFVSLASPDYRQDFRGCHVDIGDGRDKKEYRAPAVIRKKLESLDLPYSYDVLFVDIDSEVVGKGQEEIDALLARNFEGLCAVSGIGARRLSQTVDISYLEELKETAHASEKLAKQVSVLQSRPTVLVAHSISREAIADRAIIYAALGKLLEETVPETILLDIQGRIYPYEQPFYDALRRFPLPLLRLAKI